jgi:hypothetical protein
MGNIPNTNTPNLVLQSVGNGSNDSRWGTSGGGSTLPTGTGTGQMIWWNGTGWVVTITPTTGSYLYWNGTAWANAVAGDATKIQGYPVNVTGIGNGDVLYWSNVGAVQQWLTGPTPTGEGQIQYWNTSLSGHWSLSAAATTTGQALVWNNSTLTWGPANITLAGDVTGSAGANTVVNIQNYPVNMTGVGNGDLLYWSNVGTTQWLTGPTPTITGQYYAWNAGLGAWALATSSGGGVTNTAWSSESNSLSLSSTLASWGSVTVTGFSNYTVTLSSTMSGNTTTARLQQQVYQSGTGLVGPLIGINPGTTSTTYVMNVVQHLITGLSSSTSYTFYGYAAVTSGTGSVINGTIMAIGIS